MRNWDTVVIPSDWRIEKLVIAWKDGWIPTKVISVPCRVVTTGGPSSRSICCAIHADVAWGMA